MVGIRRVDDSIRLSRAARQDFRVIETAQHGPYSALSELLGSGSRADETRDLLPVTQQPLGDRVAAVTCGTRQKDLHRCFAPDLARVALGFLSPALVRNSSWIRLVVEHEAESQDAKHRR
jgi:hypothetical protein